MYTIDTIPFTDYGLLISGHEGQSNLLDMKTQFFTIYGKEGYQISKRVGNTLTINGFIIASGLIDFQSKITALQTLFKASGLRSVVLDQDAISCFCVNGFEIDKVYIYPNEAFARFKINLLIV